MDSVATKDWSPHTQLAQETVPVGDLPLARVLLANDANYPWLILVPRLPGLVELIDLEENAQVQLLDEIAAAARALKTITACDKLNIAALGNQVPQLHVHVIARRRTDAAWPKPVWGVQPPLAYKEGLQQQLSQFTAPAAQIQRARRDRPLASVLRKIIMVAAPSRILVISLRRIGDLLLTTPLIRSLRRAWPDSSIDVLVFANTAGILAGNPDINRVITMPERPTMGGRAHASSATLAALTTSQFQPRAATVPPFLLLLLPGSRAGVTTDDDPWLARTLKRIALHRSCPRRG